MASVYVHIYLHIYTRWFPTRTPSEVSNRPQLRWPKRVELRENLPLTIDVSRVEDEEDEGTEKGQRRGGVSLQFSHGCVCTVPRKGLESFLFLFLHPFSSLRWSLFFLCFFFSKTVCFPQFSSFALRHPSADNFTILLSGEIIYSTPPSWRIEVRSLPFPSLSFPSSNVPPLAFSPQFFFFEHVKENTTSKLIDCAVLRLLNL